MHGSCRCVSNCQLHAAGTDSISFGCSCMSDQGRTGAAAASLDVDNDFAEVRRLRDSLLGQGRKDGRKGKVARSWSH